MSRNPVIVLLGPRLIIGGVQVFSTACPELIHVFTGLQPAQFHRLVRQVARGAVTPSRTGVHDGRGPSPCPTG
jgi:hypothetical protein